MLAWLKNKVKKGVRTPPTHFLVAETVSPPPPQKKKSYIWWDSMHKQSANQNPHWVTEIFE